VMRNWKRSTWQKLRSTANGTIQSA